MRLRLLFFLFFPSLLFAQTNKPAITVLGVTHSGQLINSSQQPAALRAFINRVKPNAILIERSPEEFTRFDFYEFTYEQQYVIVPFAHKKRINIYPIDWLPTPEDMLLAFGANNLDVPNFTRNRNGFWGFTSFQDSSILQGGIYYAEDSMNRLRHKKWYANYPNNQANFDFARRLFLYRTNMQAKRIEAVARKFSQQDTLLVVIGDMHKDDIEKILSNTGHTIINTKNFGRITQEEIKTNYEELDAFSIATFNLLGIQSTTNFINKKLLHEAIEYIKQIKSPEAYFFETKYLLFKQDITPKAAVNRYHEILKSLPKDAKFSWNGVKDKSRLDSYIDPFGNMNLWQRIHLEIAKYNLTNKKIPDYNKEKCLLLNEFQGTKKAMLLAYWEQYIEGNNSTKMASKQ